MSMLTPTPEPVNRGRDQNERLSDATHVGVGLVVISIHLRSPPRDDADNADDADGADDGGGAGLGSFLLRILRV